MPVYLVILVRFPTSRGLQTANHVMLACLLKRTECLPVNSAPLVSILIHAMVQLQRATHASLELLLAIHVLLGPIPASWPRHPLLLVAYVELEHFR